MNPHVHISYRVTRDLNEGSMTAEMTCLSVEERARCARLAFSIDRRDFIAAHALLRQSLSARQPLDAGEWTFVRGPNGKPRVGQNHDSGNRLAFSISHTRGLVASVVASGMEVGIDVERVNERGEVLDLARRYFSSWEVAELEGCEGSVMPARFTEMWTLKEAYVKATGEGISGALDECAFTFGAAPSLRFEPADCVGADTWVFAVFEVLDYRLAVAVRDPARVLETLWIHQPAGDDSRMVGGAARLLRMSRKIAVIFEA